MSNLVKRALAIIAVPVVAVIAVVAVLIARSGATTAPGSEREREREAATTGLEPEALLPSPGLAPPVVVARSLGKLESASEEIGVASDLTGRIVEILVDEGEPVELGMPLARLDDTLYRAKVAAAEAAVRAARARKDKLDAGARPEEIRLARALLQEAEARAVNARKRAERARRLEEGGSSSEEEAEGLVREAEAREAQVRAAREELAIAEHETRAEDLAAAAAELDRAEKELEAARAELDKTVLRSPIRGTVVRRNLRVGEAVSSFQVEPVITVADLSHLRIRAEVDEIDLGKVRVGQRAFAVSDAFPELRLEGKVFRLGKTMGRRTVRSMDPNERQDIRVREVLIDLETVADLPLGLRMLVAFVE